MENDFVSRQIFSNQKKKNRPVLLQLIGLVFLIAIIIVVYGTASLFRGVSVEDVKRIEIPEGYSISETAVELQEKGLIRSAYLFVLSSKVNNGVVKSGVYQFEPGSYSQTEVRERIANAEYGNIYLSLTIPEGSTREQIADILENSNLEISREEFLALSEGKEGYLFPDTYFFLPSDTAQEVIARLSKTFEDKSEKIREQVETRGESFEDLVIMASIIEKEASNDIEEMKVVSGILWKRISEGIPLQVDAPFLFVSGKTSAQLSTKDLRTDGPYNTYTNKGLTPGPIANPGLDALEAAAQPTDSLYFFYLHDTNGDIHYAQTHDGHVNNKNRYLR